ncbi:uncharacterized protein ACN427_000557 [Glossina fuscipes fuscipes]
MAEYKGEQAVAASDANHVTSNEGVEEPPLFPGKRPNYGTNNTLELLEKIPRKVVETKLDDVLKAVKDVDNLCDYIRCKAKTNLIDHTCEYCQGRYCFKHGLPEEHEKKVKKTISIYKVQPSEKVQIVYN